MAKDPGFAKAFADARKSMGAGKTFTYQGKSYSTNRADDKPAASSRPKPRPAGMSAMTETERRAGRQAAKPPAMTETERRAGRQAAPIPAMTETERRAGRQAAPSPNLSTPAGRAAAGASLRADKAASTRKPAPVYDNSKNRNVLGEIGDFIRGGGMSGADKRKRDAAKAAEAAGKSRTVRGFSKGGYVSKGGKC